VTKIVAVTTYALLAPVREPIADALHLLSARKGLVLEVTTEDGLVGTGEAGTYGGPASVVEALIHEELAPRLFALDSRQPERVWQTLMARSHQRGDEGMLPAAVSGIDVALWDLLGKRAGLPLYQILGGYREQLPAYASAGFYAPGKGPADLADEARSYVARGFRHLKLKVGRTVDTPLSPLLHMERPELAAVTLAEDLERVTAVRAAVGDDVSIAVDANNAWDRATALAAGRVFDRLGIAWFEEPVRTQDRTGSAQLARSLDVRIAGYESQTGLAGFRDLIAEGAIDVAQPDVTWSGGFTACRRIAALADAAGLPVLPHVFSTAVSTAANLHFAAAIPNSWLLEFDQNDNPLLHDLLTEPLVPDSSAIVHVPRAPGLGITLDRTSLATFCAAPRTTSTS
jgi:L-alanine-DL-glutamate epimerase-like enolase superfamily enzyme